VDLLLMPWPALSFGAMLAGSAVQAEHRELTVGRSSAIYARLRFKPTLFALRDPENLPD
jgi:hypothetical protein